ncbi:MAG: 16S rRNA (guanine(527)-N(7))-methyltransferase RsmG [Gammaproteobacteria bacterium]|nr:16S rRNA (guanine(527)-N(7))-methyltransferase RsmG [Gammaproteobacteria bacterium]
MQKPPLSINLIYYEILIVQLQNILTTSCDQLGLVLSDEQQQKLLQYVEELNKWNKTYNLTAIRDRDEMMKRHVVDALSVVSHVQDCSPKSLADIGTGGGVPGVILAIVLPHLELDLVESIGKKCRFLRNVIQLLNLSNVNVRQQRVEEWQPDSPRDVIISRAFASLANFTAITKHLGDNNTHWLAMKSAFTSEEELELSASFMLIENRKLIVPFEEAERRLLVLKRTELK